MKTFSAKPHEVKREWFVVDATDKVLGRLASEIARRLRGNTRIRDFVGGDLTNGMLSTRRIGGNERSLRGHVGNGFGHGSSF